MDPSKVLVMKDNRQLSRKRKRDSSNSSENPPAKKALAPAKKPSPVKDSHKSRSDSKENFINAAADKDSDRRESRSRGRSRDRHQRTSDLKPRPTENATVTKTASDKGSFTTREPGSSCNRARSKEDTNRASATRNRSEECQAAEASLSMCNRASSKEDINRATGIRNRSEECQTVEAPLSSFNRACSKEDINMASALRNSLAECQPAHSVCSYENPVTTLNAEIDSSKETLKKADMNSHSSPKETANPTDNKNIRNSSKETAIKADATDRNSCKETAVSTKTEAAVRTRRDSCSDKADLSKRYEETARNSRGNSIETARNSRGNSIETARNSRGNSIETAVSSEEPPTTSGRDSRNNKKDTTANDKSSARQRDVSLESRRSYRDCKNSKVDSDCGNRRGNSRDKDER